MRPDVAEQKRQIAATSRALHVCPQCGRDLPGPGYGTGSNADGNFCSLRCLGDFWYSSPEAGAPSADGA